LAEHLNDDVARGGADHSLAAEILAFASTAVTVLRKEPDEWMISFSASTTRKNTNPARKSQGQTQSGIASLPNRRLLRLALLNEAEQRIEDDHAEDDRCVDPQVEHQLGEPASSST
jgi:hypothetical protein